MNDVGPASTLTIPSFYRINFEEGNKVFTKAGLSDATPCRYVPPGIVLYGIQSCYPLFIGFIS